MADEENTVENEDAAADEVDATAADEASDAPESNDADAATAVADAVDVGDVKVPEFASMNEGGARNEEGGMDRFLDVRVSVCAELGRVDLPLGDLVELAEGTVMRLNRPVSAPVDIVSQGVRLARGEVIVIDDCFAIRVKEIVAKK